MTSRNLLLSASLRRSRQVGRLKCALIIIDRVLYAFAVLNDPAVDDPAVDDLTGAKRRCTPRRCRATCGGDPRGDPRQFMATAGAQDPLS